ncbi:hypothetical protein TNCV_571071 [Trichonephila clavipes]|nr:hypothetical protein TNCV_571071 [Trichonephila clavipes]
MFSGHRLTRATQSTVRRVGDTKDAFTSRQSESSVERLANQRLHIARDKVSDWVCNADLESEKIMALLNSELLSDDCSTGLAGYSIAEQHGAAQPSDSLAPLTYAELYIPLLEEMITLLFLLFTDGIRVNVSQVLCPFGAASKNKLLFSVSAVEN